MLLWIISFLRGYLVIEARGVFIERFINLCIRGEIYLWDIRKTEKDRAEMKISIRGFKRIRHAAKKSRTRVRILKRCGLPLLLARYRHRKAFFAGALIFLAVIFALTSFIWSVDISGVKGEEQKEIRKQLSTCGIDVGVIKYGHSPSEIKEKMLGINPYISWIWVDVRGTKVYVEVKKRHEIPDMADNKVPCNIVAKRDGVIKDYIVKAGQMVLKVGDFVREGQLIVSGAVDSSVLGARLVPSDAEINAITWYEEGGVFPLFYNEVSKTGEASKKHSISIFGAEIPIWGKMGEPYKSFEKAESEKQLKLWGDIYLPVTYKCTQFFETKTEKVELTEDEAKEKFGNELYEKIKNNLGNSAKIIKRKIEHKMTDDGKISVLCHVECVEDIGTKEEIAEGGNN